MADDKKTRINVFLDVDIGDPKIYSQEMEEYKLAEEFLMVSCKTEI